MKIPEDHSDYKKRFLILPHEVIEPLYSWHGGQWSGVYSLASTGDHDLVSPAMIERAMSELEQRSQQDQGERKTSLIRKKTATNCLENEWNSGLRPGLPSTSCSVDFFLPSGSLVLMREIGVGSIPWDLVESYVAQEEGAIAGIREEGGAVGQYRVVGPRIARTFQIVDEGTRSPGYRATQPIIVVEKTGRQLPMTPEEFDAKFGARIKFARQYGNIYRATGPQYVKSSWWFESHIIDGTGKDATPKNPGAGYPLSVSVLLPDAFAQQFATDWLTYVASFLPLWSWPIGGSGGPYGLNIWAQVRASKMIGGPNQPTGMSFQFALCNPAPCPGL